MLLGRSQETKNLEAYYEREGSQLVVLYGRENVGKTSLLMDFCKDKTYSYYLARPCSEKEQLYLWSKEIQSDFKALDVTCEFSSIFSSITTVKSAKKIIVIDEFQYIVKTSTQFMKEIINLIHNAWNNQPVLVVLCSSSIGFIENTMVSKIGQSAYEITGFLKVKELNFLDLVRKFSKYSVEQCVEVYSILGGVPGLWRYFNQNLSVKENICRTILKQGTVLYDEARRFVSEELREPTVYHTILEAIASGDEKLNELYLKTDYSRAKISVYLKNLMELEIVEKVYSIDTAGRENTKKGIYRISNHFVYFWFRYLFPNLSKLQLMTEEEFYDQYIADTLRNYTASSFTSVCMEYLNLLNQSGKLELKYQRAGSWVGKVGTIDIAAVSDSGKTLVGICNWEHSIMTYEDYEWLLFCAEQAKMNIDYIYLFTVGGFDEKLHAESKIKGYIHLIDLSQL